MYCGLWAVGDVHRRILFNGPQILVYSRFLLLATTARVIGRDAKLPVPDSHTVGSSGAQIHIGLDYIRIYNRLVLTVKCLKSCQKLITV